MWYPCAQGSVHNFLPFIHPTVELLVKVIFRWSGLKYTYKNRFKGTVGVISSDPPSFSDKKCLFLWVSPLFQINNFRRDTANEKKQFKETKTNWYPIYLDSYNSVYYLCPLPFIFLFIFSITFIIYLHKKEHMLTLNSFLNIIVSMELSSIYLF